MKNFKRVISAVIALALSASTLVAVSANKFTDVEDTNRYAEAIEVLTALDIVHGYEEDGTVVFKPEGEITRAEAATMIVGALNMNSDAKAAAGTSKFTDVNEKASWAAGYVNVGVSQGFIHGHDDTTFAPQDNVTYAQMCVMLTLITGYGDYAAAYGGYPTGYTQIAASSGINNGVAVSNDTPLKRGQVAQMLYNALTTPMLGITVYKLSGNEYEELDGTGAKAFKTILSDKFDGYSVKVKVTDTPNSSTVEKGKANLKVTKDASIGPKNTDKVYNGDTTEFSGILIDDVDIEPYFLKEGYAIVKKDADDKWHLLYFKAGSETASEFAAADHKSTEYDATSGKYTFKFGTGKEYKVAAADINKLYVNNTDVSATGAAWAMTDTTAAKSNWTKLFAGAQGNIRFVKEVVGGVEKTNIFVDYYITGQVNSVKYSNNETTLSFSAATTDAGTILGTKTTKVVIADEDVADGKVEVTVKRNGEAVELKDLKEDDVIAIYTTEYTTKEIKAPKTITVLASDATEAGLATAKDDTSITLNGTKYGFSAGQASTFNGKVGTTFTATIDPFGNLYSILEEVSAKKYALVLDYDGENVSLLTKDGTRKSYEVGTTAKTAITTAMASTNAEARVIEYEVSAKKNQVTSATLVAATQDTLTWSTATPPTVTNDKEAYNETVKRVGTIYLSDASYIIDATAAPADLYTSKAYGNKLDYAKLSTFNALKNDVKYEAYGWDKSSTDNTCAFVIVREAGSKINSDSRFAVGKSTIGQIMIDDENAYEITVLYEGEEKALKIEKDANVYDAIADTKTSIATLYGTNGSGSDKLQGKAFYFTTDADGIVNDIYVVFNGKAAADVTGTVIANLDGTTSTVIPQAIDGTIWANTIGSVPSNKEVRIVYGLVSDLSANQVTFVYGTTLTQVAKTDTTTTPPTVIHPAFNYFDIGDVEKFNFASDCGKYSYAINSTESDEEDKISEGGLAKSVFNNFKYVDDSTKIWKKTATGAGSADKNIAKGADDADAWTDNANYAFAVIVNNQVVDIYQIVK